jgi:hypothetical protein
MMREPASRTASYLTWKKRHGEIDQQVSLSEYVERCRDLGPSAVSTQELNPYSGLYGSDYATYLAPWARAFGDRLRVAYLDDVRDRPQDLLEALADWLEISRPVADDARVRVANPAKQVRSPRAERAIRRLGRGAQPLAQHAPGVYRALRDSARLVNMRRSSPAHDADDATRDLLREFFEPGRRELLGLVHRHELLGSPGWLLGQE